MSTSDVPSQDVQSCCISTTGFFTVIITTVLAVAIVSYVRRAVRGKHAKSKASLQGKTAIVTGSNTGIGKETARDFVKRGARVIMACRNLDKANEAANDIRMQYPKADIVVMQLDLASFDSIRKFAKEVLDSQPHIDILVNNAGLVCPKSKTKDGYDMIFGTNHLGTFLLTYLLLDRIKKSAPARIVTVASAAHYLTFSMKWNDLNFDEPSMLLVLKSYCHSKLANILFTKELARKLEGTGVTTYCLHPGVIKTELNRDLDKNFGTLFQIYMKILLRYFSKTPVQGAQTTIYCAVDENLKNKTGLYYSNCTETTPGKAARDAEAAKKLWEVSLKMVGIDKDNTDKNKLIVSLILSEHNGNYAY